MVVKKCTCGLCYDCLPQRVDEITFSRTKAVRDRALVSTQDSNMREVINAACDDSLIYWNVSEERIALRIKYYETVMSCLDSILKYKVITTRKQALKDPKNVAEFKAALLRERERINGEKSPTKKPKVVASPENKIRTMRYKSDNEEEKKVLKALYQAQTTQIPLSMLIPLLKASYPKIDIELLMRKAGISV